MMAQAVTGTPGHVNSMAESVGHFLGKFPADTMREGDHYITNDPWLGTGHLHDLTVVTPAFRDGRIVGLFANTAHVIDIGGLGMGPEGRSVFEEGMYIPIVKCFDQGRPNETFFDFIRAGSRLPVEIEGDIYSLCACNDAGARRLVEMMDEFEMDSLDPLADFIFDSSHRATLAEIARIPQGTYRAEIRSDGYEEPVTLKAAMTIFDDGIEVDFAGTSGLSSRGINVPPAYCRAYACFGIKCVVAPDIPNNWASLAPFRMNIPEGCILNAPHPYPVSVRHVIGHLLPDLMMGCLHQAVPERVTAEGASALWNPPLRGGSSVSGQARGNRPVVPDFEIITFNSGGTGARPTSGWPERHSFPVRRAHDAGGSNRECRADRLLAEGTSARFRRRRPHPRRHRPDHGDRRQGRSGIRRQRQLRSHSQRAERPRGRTGRCSRRGDAEVRQDAAHQGLPGHSGRGSADSATARRRRHGRSDRTRSCPGRARRARRIGFGRKRSRSLYKEVRRGRIGTLRRSRNRYRHLRMTDREVPWPCAAT